MRLVSDKAAAGGFMHDDHVICHTRQVAENKMAGVEPARALG